MKSMKVYASLVALLLLVFPLSQAWADECQDAANLFRKAGASAKFFDTSYGYAIFPNIGKGGIGVGGAYGKGCVYEQPRTRRTCRKAPLRPPVSVGVRAAWRGAPPLQPWR